MKVGVFIPVRLDSNRLPRKAMLDIMGKPAIQHLCERLKLSQRADAIVICTSDEPSDEALVDVARAAGVSIFRGSKEDLMQRFLLAAREHNLDLIVNVDGDDLLVDPEQVDSMAEALERTGADFIRFDGLPFGGVPVGVRVDALARACELKAETDTATGWGRYFSDTNLFRTENIRIEDQELNHPDIRMTLDYEEDYKFFKAVFEELYRPGQPVRLREAVRLIVSRPDIKAINSGLEEKYWAHFNAAKAPALKSS